MVNIKRLSDDIYNYLVSMRREFHRFPEVSSNEVNTRKIIIRELEKSGVPYRLLRGTGIIAFLDSGRPGKNRLLRADMDALPLNEDKRNLCSEKVSVSENYGVCHACGHDAHMAMLLGTIKVLSELRGNEVFTGKVYCCFEEGEEATTGVYTMLDALSEYRIDECFALHVYSELDSGKININAGPVMAGTVGIGFLVKGRSGHGSRPDQAANPIVPAAHIITQIDSAFRNQIDPEKTVTLSFCMMQSGEANNVIPDEAYIGGTARFFDPEEGEKAFDIINNIAEHTAACHKCTIEFLPRNQIVLQPVINDPVVAGCISNKLKSLYSECISPDCGKWYASESYSRYLERYPGALGLLGIRNESLGSGAPHHNGKFDIDEECMKLGVAAELSFILEEGETNG